ncbi:hypothetical protein AX17_000138 [Amanita inopinata Kibby_2008]|nr:hypothetical protein AX17_000138 [Amanita inopinata Kibby_2008]
MMVTEARPDLTTIEGVGKYLVETPFSSRGEILALNGGSANYAYRVRLDKPYGGQATVIVKHARPYVKNIATLPFDLSRQRFEVEALKRVKSLIPNDALVTVPDVYFFDEKEHVIVMQDCGDASVSLKQFMLEGRLSASMGERLGKGLGEFLGQLHVWGRDRAAWQLFDANQQAKEMSAWVYYGRLYETLDVGQNAGVASLRDPPLEVDLQDMEVIKHVAEKMGSAIRNADETFVMGDFWPGNVMVAVDKDGDVERVYVIDWELCKPGLAGVEIGQFCAEIYFVRHFYAEYGAAASAVLSTFLDAYESIAGVDETVMKIATQHFGAHLVVIGPRVGWRGKEATRAAVRKGVRLLVIGCSDGSEIRRVLLRGG